MGDLLTTVPALKSLRKGFPRSEIVLIGLPWAEEFVQRYSNLIDDFMSFPGFMGLPEQPFDPEKFSAFLSKVQDEEFDLAIQMQGSGSITNGMMEMFEAKMLAGFYGPEAHRPNKRFFIKYPKSGHEAERFLQLMENLGAEREETEINFPISEAEEAAAEKLLREYGLSEKEFICIHPGAREEARRWNPTNFAEAADFVASKGYKIAFTGIERERDYVEKIKRQMDFSSVNLSGKTNLGEIAAVLKKSALLIANDTGIVHIASAACAESVIIYTKKGSNIERWAPLDRENHTIITPLKAQWVDEVLKEIDVTLREKTLQRANRNYEHARAI